MFTFFLPPVRRSLKVPAIFAIMKISILLPVFNAAPFVRECLDSILTQTEQDWELLAVDDFSADDSLVILQEYAACDSRIRVLYKKQMPGIAPSLRLAFLRSGGELVTRMDSDDRMAPGKLAALKNLLLSHGRQHVATGLVEYFSEKTLGDGYRRYAAWLNELALSGQQFQEIYKECVVPSPCWMAWRNDLEAIGAFGEDVYPEDYDLCFRWYAAGHRIFSHPQTLHYWRDHPTRTSRTDEKYLDNAYLDLKTRWFLRTDRQADRPLVLWGAGKKGKRLASLFTQAEVPFHWVCDNEKKWGKRLSGVVLQHFEIISTLPRPQIIVAVAEPQGQRDILDFLQALNFERSKDFFFFC
jgi:glycosyltransferase involved in cell wall biosynthesis